MTHPFSSSEAVTDRSIGDIIRVANNLSAEHVEQILSYQKQHDVKFGEAAVALGLIQREDVLWALSQQFHYPYSAAGGDIKISEELVTASNPFGSSAEAFRDLRSQLISNVFKPDGPRKAIAVLSPNTGDGKSYFAANIAVAFSQLGGRTLLVDADMRTPRQQEIFGIDSGSGLSSILSGRAETNLIKPVPILSSLYILPVGIVPPNPVELVQRPAFGFLMAELLSKFDYVIVDTPAAAHGSDARVIAGTCGAAVVVGRRGSSRLEGVQKLVTSVQKTSAKVVGIVMNDY